MKNKIEVKKVSEAKQNNFTNLLDLLVNNNPCDFFVNEKGTKIHIYLKDEHMRSIEFNIDGTWDLG